MKTKHRRTVFLLLAAAALVICVLTLSLLPNSTLAARYAVKGVDVSSYQGDIDWQLLASQPISFAFIKATEGSSFTDSRFAENFYAAKQTGLVIGAYHFFSYDSAGETQAENFISAVTPFAGMLPPVIDLEFYGDYYTSPPDRADVEPQLKAMLQRLERHYGQKPIIYATERSYRLYLAGDYSEYDIWLRDVRGVPRLSDGRQWTLWQYSARGQLSGYSGKERFIDMNVFCGDETAFAAWLKDSCWQE
ncbi:MAG: glycoside hydrolase family 25 protein [Oscillospiraceae bacterium]|nr:glycoside hydrolase family 25 protein [Oscillospiraceae bacterium]